MNIVYPYYINTPFKAMGVESDVLTIAFITFGLGLHVSSLFSFVLAPVVTMIYIQSKKKRPSGFILHIPYILGLKTFDNFDDVFHTEYYE